MGHVTLLGIMYLLSVKDCVHCQSMNCGLKLSCKPLGVEFHYIVSQAECGRCFVNGVDGVRVPSLT